MNLPVENHVQALHQKDICIVAWRVSWLTMLSRVTQSASPAAVFTEAEHDLLKRATPDRKRNDPRDLDFYVRTIARLGLLTSR